MDIDNLPPGIYKIRKKPDPRFKTRRHTSEVVILRISIRQNERRYYVNHDTHGEEPGRTNFNDQFELVGKYTTSPHVYKPKISLAFKDSTGDSFVIAVTSLEEVRNVFEQMPWLREAFGYVPNRSKIVRLPWQR